MRVLQINTWYSIYSTGKLVKSIHQQCLKEGIDSFVIFGRGKLDKQEKKEKRVFKGAYTLETKANSVLSRFSGIPYGGCFFSTIRTIRLIKRIKPDVIHIHCTNSFVVNNYKLFKFIGENNYKVVITLHAEYLYTGSCGHKLDCNQWKTGCQKCPQLKSATRAIFFDRTKTAWKRMFKALNYIDKSSRTIVTVSDWLKGYASQSLTFKNDSISTVNNGINTSIFKKYDDKDNEFAYLKENNQKVLLYVTPNFRNNETDIKGGDNFIKIVNNFKDNRNIVFAVAGRNTTNYDFSKHKNVLYLGEILDQVKLAKLYSISDATLMISRKETYSLVTAESLSCGTPIIGFKSGGPESIAVKEYSVFFEQGDVDGISKYIKKYTLESKPNVIINNYSESIMNEKYISIYREIMKK